MIPRLFPTLMKQRSLMRKTHHSVEVYSEIHVVIMQKSISILILTKESPCILIQNQSEKQHSTKQPQVNNLVKTFKYITHTPFVYIQELLTSWITCSKNGRIFQGSFKQGANHVSECLMEFKAHCPDSGAPLSLINDPDC